MKKTSPKLFSRLVICVPILLIVICFITSTYVIRDYAQKDCFDHIEESTMQAAVMFTHTMDQNQRQLMLFADILAANSSNPDELLRTYMENFCKTQRFSAVCIHRAEGRVSSYGFHPHEQVTVASFEEEVSRLPYTSGVLSGGEGRADQYVYQAVPIIRDGQTIAVLYGYISLDTFPTFVSATAYDGKGALCIMDGNTGDFLMDEYHRYDENGNEIPLRNIADPIIINREMKPGYTADKMMTDVRLGNSGHLVFKSQQTDQWYYTCYMPMDVNNWSMQLTIDEASAFTTSNRVNDIIAQLMAFVIGCMLILILMLFVRNANDRKRDTANLHRADYINAVQNALITAHNNPDFVDQALKIMAKEISAETVLLLTFSDKVISEAYYWPSADKSQAMALLGLNIREVFPVFFDRLSSKESVFFVMSEDEGEISEKAAAIFREFDIENIMLVPIMDNTGGLKGVISGINLPQKDASPRMLECVTHDFFMAISNLESHTIIKNMGSMDYLTKLKNRNCFETEVSSYETVEGDSLWCMYVDVNGLHELNNQHGHKAGDLMLCTIAATIKKLFGSQGSYRLGGDEFVAFRINATAEDLTNLKHRLRHEIGKNGYTASLGFAGVVRNANGAFDVEALMADAEKIMCQDKKEYYEKNHLSTDRNHDQAAAE